MPFDNAPEMEQVETIISGWQRPELPDGLKHLARNLGERSVVELARLVRESLSKIQGSRYRNQLEARFISWLYDFIRANVKRGRVFDLGEVLRQGHADCLGYARLFTLLGRLFGLDVGVVEVVIDNRVIQDIELRELGRQEEVCYLPDLCVDAITLYIRGNRYLDRQEFDIAIKYYSRALRLYPGNARFFYNRAVARENLGEHQKAQADYARALCNDAAMIRILAREHDEVTSLLDLDAEGIHDLAQAIYLLNKGFATGKEVPPAEVARKFGLSDAEVRDVLSSVEAKLALSSDENRL